MAQQTPAPGITARIPIWSPGEYTSLRGDTYQFAASDLQAAAAAYQPSIFRAPWVKGHPQVADPAYGWGDRLEWDGEYLWANSSQIDAGFADEVRAGRWGKISPTFFPPDHPDNPVPGVWYLKNIGWLGAHAPANKRLPSPEFADPESSLVVFAESLDAGQVDFSHPKPKEEPLMADTPATTADSDAAARREAAFAEREADLNRRAADIEQRETALQQQTTQRHHDDCAAFAEQLAGEGRILPCDQAFITELLNAIPADATVEFAEGDQKVTAATGQRLREFLSGLPVQVEFGELAPGGEKREAVAEFAAPAGYSVDRVRGELHRKAVTYQKQHPDVDYAGAVRAVI